MDPVHSCLPGTGKASASLPTFHETCPGQEWLGKCPILGLKLTPFCWPKLIADKKKLFAHLPHVFHIHCPPRFYCITKSLVSLFIPAKWIPIGIYKIVSSLYDHYMSNISPYYHYISLYLSLYNIHQYILNTYIYIKYIFSLFIYIIIIYIYVYTHPSIHHVHILPEPRQIFSLPGDFIVCPGHDYKGRSVSLVAEDRNFGSHGHRKSHDFQPTTPGNAWKPWENADWSNINLDSWWFMVNDGLWMGLM